MFKVMEGRGGGGRKPCSGRREGWVTSAMFKVMVGEARQPCSR